MGNNASFIWPDTYDLDVFGGVIAYDGEDWAARWFPEGNHTNITEVQVQNMYLPSMHGTMDRISIAEGCSAILTSNLGAQFKLNDEDQGFGKGMVEYSGGRDTFPADWIEGIRVICDKTKYCNRVDRIGLPACASLCKPWDTEVCTDNVKRSYCEEVMRTKHAESDEYKSCRCMMVGPGDPRRDPDSKKGVAPGNAMKDPNYPVERMLFNANNGNMACWSPRCVGEDEDGVAQFQLFEMFNNTAMAGCKTYSMCDIDMGDADITVYGGMVTIKNDCSNHVSANDDLGVEGGEAIGGGGGAGAPRPPVSTPAPKPNPAPNPNLAPTPITDRTPVPTPGVNSGLGAGTILIIILFVASLLLAVFVARKKS